MIAVIFDVVREFTRQVLVRIAVTKVGIKRKFFWDLINDSIELLDAILQVELLLQAQLLLVLDEAPVRINLVHRFFVEKIIFVLV